MNVSRVLRLIGYAWAVALLAACNGGPPAPNDNAAPFNPSTGARAATPFSTAFSGRAGIVRPDRRSSWISSEVSSDKKRKHAFLFVTDSTTDDVYIFRFPRLKLVGTLTGFDNPQGECTDTGGDVWITNGDTAQIFEYSHTGALKATLSDPVIDPDGCAWDPTTGNLAVMNLEGPSSAPGSVEIYTHASGMPTQYTNPSQAYYYFGSYDPTGNLYFDGRLPSGGFVLSELPRGGSSAHTFKITGGAIYFPGMVQSFSGNFLVIGDQHCNNTYSACIYTVSLSSGPPVGAITGRVNLYNYLGHNNLRHDRWLVLRQLHRRRR